MIAIIVNSMRGLMRTVRGLKLMLIGVGSLLVLFSLAPASATSANISHSYKSTDAIPNASIVSLDPQRSDYVEASNTGNAARLLGVAVATDDSLLAIDADSTKVQIATSGTASVLVSTLNGSINVGDQVAVSPFNGVGMKAEHGSHVIGLAQTSFSSRSDGANKQEVTGKDGKKSQIEIGYVRLSIGVGTASTTGSDASLTGVQRLAKGITGRTVSTLRVIVSLIVATVSLVALITLIYASIYGSIISIGRNPLAKYAVFRTMSSVIAMALLTAVIASLTIFFLLR